MSELSAFDERLKHHATLSSIGFLVLLPVGALVGRYLRTFSSRWFWAHWIIQFLISGPIIFAGWAMGYKSVSVAMTGHFMDPHEKTGLALLILYLVQVLLGAFVHAVKTPSLFRGHRPPQNYLHALLGLAIIALAFYQVHYGIYTEWLFRTGDGTVPPMSAKRAWPAVLVVFWALYAIGLAFLPRQYKQEAALRSGAPRKEKLSSLEGNSATSQT